MGCCSHDQGKGHCHHHHGHSSCCCGDSHCNCRCAEEVCEIEEHDDCNGDKLLELADMAWMELLKEKIKEHIRATDTKMDALAKLVAEANHKRWAHKMNKEKCCAEYDKCCDDYEEQLCKLFSSCGDDSCKKK